MNAQPQPALSSMPSPASLFLEINGAFLLGTELGIKEHVYLSDQRCLCVWLFASSVLNVRMSVHDLMTMQSTVARVSGNTGISELAVALRHAWTNPLTTRAA